jgi:hypothetical protein
MTKSNDLSTDLTPLHAIDLANDPAARRYVKSETVSVTFATEAGSILSREGGNTFTAGDALITGSTGDRWSVTRDRFDLRYSPMPPTVHGEAGHYRNLRIPVLAKQMAHDFTLRRTAGGDLLQGRGGDWLMQYAPGDYGIVEQAKFDKVYRVMDTHS